jgi:hypothetical protein
MNIAATDSSGAARSGWLSRLGRFRFRRGRRIDDVDRTLIAAQGKALLLLTTTLHARGSLDADEFAEVLGIFSVLSAEENELEGNVLAIWAGIMKDGRQAVEAQSLKADEP